MAVQNAGKSSLLNEHGLKLTIRHSETLCFIPRERPAMPQLPPAWSMALPLATTGSQSCSHPLSGT